MTFLRRIVPGGADDSYGIQVAKLAGIPNSVINRAKEILNELESGKQNDKTNDQVSNGSQDNEQISLVPNVSDLISKKLKNIDINVLTPIEAMNLLFEISKIID